MERDSSGASRQSRWKTITLYVGLGAYGASFFLPAVGFWRGWECAVLSLLFSLSKDDKVSPLALFGGILNFLLIAYLLLRIAKKGATLRAFLTVESLFCVAMSRFALQHMEMDLNIGYYMWTTAILLILLPDIPSVFTIPSARWLATAALPVVLWVGTPTAISLTMHPASERDDFFYVVAWNLKEPVVCGKIDPRAIGRKDQRTGSDLTYLQSDCYRNLAALLNFPQFCANVKSAGVDRLADSVVARRECRNQRFNPGIVLPLSGESFVRTMRSLGYGDEYLADWIYEGNPGNTIYELHSRLLRDPLFVEAVRKAPTSGESFSPGHLRPALPLEYVYELTGVQKKDWTYCRHISPAATYLFGSHPEPSYSLRFACEFEVALHARDTPLCRELAQGSRSPLVNRPFSARQCMESLEAIRAAESQNWEAPLVRYAEEVVPAREEYLEALKELGYARGLTWAQLVKPTGEQYWDYLWYVATANAYQYPENIKRGAARDEFLSRVLATK